MTDNSLEVVIFGCGGFGREVLWALRHPDALVTTEDGVNHRPKVLGFVDDDSSTHGQLHNGEPVLGGTDWVQQQKGIAVLIGIGIPRIRRQIAERLVNAGATFPSFVSPLALVGDEVRIGRGVIITPGSISTCNISYGDFAMVNLNVTVGHDVSVGPYTTLSPGANISGHVSIGEGCDLGTNCTVIPGKTIGANSVIGAMACVTKDIPDGATAVGIPAKVIKISE